MSALFCPLCAALGSAHASAGGTRRSLGAHLLCNPQTRWHRARRWGETTALSAKLPASEGCVLACTCDEARPPSEAWSCNETWAARSDTCARRLCRRGCPTVVYEAASENGAAGTLASLVHPSLPSHRSLLKDASDAEVMITGFYS